MKHNITMYVTIDILPHKYATSCDILLYNDMNCNQIISYYVLCDIWYHVSSYINISIPMSSQDTKNYHVTSYLWEYMLPNTIILYLMWYIISYIIVCHYISTNHNQWHYMICHHIAKNLVVRNHMGFKVIIY
jgi:hypothetical protein